MTAATRAAARLAAARTGGGARIDALPAALRPADEAQAYEIQRLLHKHLTAAGHGPVCGHKIGCTTPVMQRYLGIAHPCAGGVFERTVHGAPAAVEASGFCRVGVECEIAVRLGRDLAGPPASRDELAGAVSGVMAAMEIVDDRYVDYASIGVLTLIADDFFNAGCVLGEPVVSWRAIDLAALSGRMWINAREAGAGVGADIMGHPLDALAWLDNARAGQGRRLRAGEFVLLGSLVQTQWLAAGDEVRIEVDGLGGAELSLS